VLTWAGCSCDSALPFPSAGFAVVVLIFVVRSGEGTASLVGVCSRSRVQVSRGLVGVLGSGANLDGVTCVSGALVGDAVGVVYLSGDGEAGDSARRNGELRAGGGEP
jgi:hypothetical protein